MRFKVTVDGGLLRRRDPGAALGKLKEWAAEGKIEIFESDRAQERPVANGWPGQTTRTGPNARYKPIKKAESRGVTFALLSAVIYPRRDPNRLTMGETNGVAHLLQHHLLQHTIFVTENAKDYLDEGKQSRFQTAFKIVVLTPEEAVQAIEAAERKSL